MSCSENPLIVHCSNVCVNALNFYLLYERVWLGDVRKTSGEMSYWARVLAEKSREPEFKFLVPTLKNKQKRAVWWRQIPLIPAEEAETDGSL